LTEQVLYRADEPPQHRIRPDLKGTVIEAEHCTMVRWVIPAGQDPTPLHAHAEFEQICTVLSGAIETTVGGEVLVARGGDTFRIRRGVVHGATRALDGRDAVVLDVFTPPRREYVEAARREAGR
jgi:quercetin dioxygenase-like cupin family protein